MIDTGAQVTIGNSALLARSTARRRPPPARPVTLISVTGQSSSPSQIMLPEIEIGGDHAART